MKNKHVQYEIDREIGILNGYLRDIIMIHEDGSKNWVKQNTLSALEQDALRILAFVHHIKALQNVEELPDN